MNRTRKTVILLCLVLLGLSYIYTAVYFQFSSSSTTGIIQPDIVLEQGTSGTSVVYSNGTSASISVDSYSTTFFPQDYNVNFGQYISGSTPASVNQIDSEYFKVNATGSSTANQVYYPSSMTLLNSTTNVFDWGITSSSFTSTATHTSYRYMGGTSPDIANMKVTKLHIRTNGAGTVAIGLYTGGTLNDPTGASKQTEAYNVAVVAGWNEIDVPDYIWPQNTTSWIGWAHNTGVYYSDQSSDAGDFQTGNGRWNQDLPADADETSAMPSSPTSGSFNPYWYAVYAEYEVGSLGNLTANDGVYMRLSSYLSAVTNAEDPVDNDTSDVDGSADKGFDSNFTLQKIGPDAQYDTLREEFFGSLKFDYVDNNITNVDSSQGFGSHSNFTAQKSGPDAGYDTLTEGEKGIVESVEELAINLSTSSTSNTASLTEATDTSQVVPFATRYVVAAGGTMDNHESTLIDISINGSTVTASRYQADSKQVNTTIYWVEFGEPINVYSGTFTLSHGDGTGTANIGANISSSKSFLVFYYQASGTGNQHTDNAIRGNITSTNQITFSRATSSGIISGHWWVVEDTGTNWEVDRVDVTLTGATNTGSFDAVVMNKTMVVGSYSGGYLDDIIDGGASIYLSSPTQVSVVRGGTSGSIEATIYIIEFTGSTTVQRGDISYTGAQTSLTDPVSSVTLGDSMAWIPTGWINTGHCIFGGTGSSDNLDVMIRARLTSDTVITGERNNNGFNDAVLHWEVVEWEIVSNVIDLEEQWTLVPDYYQGAEIVIKTGAFNGSEQLRIDFWNSSSQWMTLGTLSANAWNNFTIGSFLTSDNFTIRFKGVTETADLTKDTWQIDASIIRLLGKADGEIPVQFDTSDVDSSPNIGVHSNFTAHKLGPDASYDVLTEAKYVNTTLVDEEGFEGTWVPIGWSSTGGWSNETDQAHNGIVSADIDGVVNVTLIDNESFESWPPTGWTAGIYWNGETDEAHDGITSADIDGPGGSGDLDSPSFNCTDARALYLSFWFMDDDLDANNLILQFWDGLSWDNIQDLTGFTEDTWHYIEFNVSDSQYYIDDFQFRFAATNVGWGEHFYIDEVTLIREPTLGGPETSGNLTTPSINCTGAHSVYVSFWFRDDGLDSGDLDLEYWNGSAWNTIQDLTGYTEDTWNYLELNVTDSQYYISDFKVRFSADTLGYNEHFYIDDVMIIRETQVSSDEELDVEVQWINLESDLLYEELCIYAGTLGSEDIVVEVWNTTTLGWDTVFSDLTASSWNNASITSWLTSDTLTIRYRGANSTGDTVKDQWEIDIALVHLWDEGTAEYSLDFEYQWTGVDFTESNEELCIYAGTMGAEDILVDVWNGTWNNVFTDLTPGWNNISVTQYLNSSTFTLRVRDGTPSSDALYDTWDIDISLLHLWGETYTAEIELEGTSNTYEWTQIEWITDTSYTNSSIRVEIQLYNYTATGYPVTGNGFMNYTSGTADTDETKNQVITESPDDFRNSTGGWKLKIKAEQNSPFDFNLDYIALDTTYYDEYTSQTEFIFNDITDSQSPHLNFTALTYNSVDGGNITIQVWNYSTSSYPTSEQGYLTYISNAYESWLTGWDQRVKMSLDANDIDGALSDFPVLIYLSSSSGRNGDDVSFVFDELQNDANRRKIAVTTNDGTTQCYVEIEEWDDASEEAWLWVKVPLVNNTVDTDLYLYYDVDHADNTAYIGDPNSSPAEAVWGNDFRLVTHMRDDPDTSHIRDSTGFNNDGTKTGANEPLVTVSGNVSEAQDFDGSDDYVDLGSDSSLDLRSSNFTIEAWIYPRTQTTNWPIIYSDGVWELSLGIGQDTNTDKLEVWVNDNDDYASDSSVTYNAWNYVVLSWNSSHYNFFMDGDPDGSRSGSSYPDTGTTFIGGISGQNDSWYNGTMDEVRTSNTSRTIPWISASFESGVDNLIDYGGEEIASDYLKQLDPQWLNISINPSSCINNTDAKIRVTAVYSTTQDYQNFVDFIRLLQDPIQKIHNYALRVKNLGVDTYNLRLVSLSETGLPRLINCTILLNSTTQIQVIDGTITLDTGTWTNIPGSGNQDIIIMASSINQDIPSTFELELEARKDTTTIVTYYPIMTTVR